jgi:oligoribonuclease NrnB/cAMP/cGMP phosphodiesterase (DHH superfamily)
MKPLVIFHGQCPDGFAAAWACHRLLGDVELFEGFHGQPPPEVRDRDVLVLDFAYPRATLLEMHSNAARLRVLDHHKTAADELAGLDFCTFDMERSGAGLAWDVLAPPGTTRPWLVDYVEDRDLWRFDLADSLFVNDAIMVEPYTFEAWDALASRELATLVPEGRAIRRKVDAYCRATAANAREVEIDGRAAAIVNAPHVMVSDLLNYIRAERKTEIAIAWWQRADGIHQYSLRSVGDLDVSAIAKRFGGGGHRNAAGFQSPTRVW